MKKLIVVLCFLFSVPAWAGYYAVITSSNSSQYAAVGVTSTCYLTPSMAINWFGVRQGQVLTVTAMASDASTFSASFSNGSYILSGTVGICSASPAVGGLPQFLGGLSDPAISGNSVLSGSSGSSGSSSSSADTQALTAAVTSVSTGVQALVTKSQALNGSVAVMADGVGNLATAVNNVATATSPVDMPDLNASVNRVSPQEIVVYAGAFLAFAMGFIAKF